MMNDQCLSFFMRNMSWRSLWQSSLLIKILSKFGSSWPMIYPTLSQYINTIASENHDNSEDEEEDDDDGDDDEGNFVNLLHPSIQGRNNDTISDDDEDLYRSMQSLSKWYVSNGGSDRVSLFSQRGRRKEINQDAMLAWEKFGCDKEHGEGTMFCGVFDGHGRHGHRVSRSVRDRLPNILARSWQRLQPCLDDIRNYSSFSSSSNSDDSETDNNNIVSDHYHQHFMMRGDPSHIFAWKESFHAAYKKMDKELARGDFDTLSSGTTAVALIKQGDDLIVANVGDSRAVLGTRADDDSILALQLTVDLKPDVPREAERIRRHKGRVFPLPEEPSVHRVWLPYHKSPGLAMTRTLGDHCVKKYGVISEPEVTYRRLSLKDEFVVLASDGVWDVLTNEEVVETVASTHDRSFAAKAVVSRAVNAWKAKNAGSKTDDCAVVCLFFV